MSKIGRVIKSSIIKDDRIVIGNYRLEKTIGEGTFGKVKLGIHIPTEERVAVKILEKEKIQDKEDLDRITREITFLKKLRHPNIIKIYEIIENSKNFYIIMEYASGGELFNYIVNKRHLDEHEASFFFMQVINGLEFIHKNSIVHRDMKPENLLLTKNNNVKIIDFGLSNNYKPGQLLQTPCGSPCYAAPEMILGRKYSGLLVDTWSSGIILYAMLCGYLPFEDKNNEKLYNKILECKLDFPEYLSANSKDLIKKILTVNPSRRIKLEEIKAHPFMRAGTKEVNKEGNKEWNKEGTNLFTESTTKLNVKPVELVLEKMINMGFDRNDVVYNIENNKHNNTTTTYDLLINKQKTDLSMNSLYTKVSSSSNNNNKQVVTEISENITNSNEKPNKDNEEDKEVKNPPNSNNTLNSNNALNSTNSNKANNINININYRNKIGNINININEKDNNNNNNNINNISCTNGATTPCNDKPLTKDDLEITTTEISPYKKKSSKNNNTQMGALNTSRDRSSNYKSSTRREKIVASLTKPSNHHKSNTLGYSQGNSGRFIKPSVKDNNNSLTLDLPTYIQNNKNESNNLILHSNTLHNVNRIGCGYYKNSYNIHLVPTSPRGNNYGAFNKNINTSITFEKNIDLANMLKIPNSSKFVPSNTIDLMSSVSGNKKIITTEVLNKSRCKTSNSISEATFIKRSYSSNNEESKEPKGNARNVNIDLMDLRRQREKTSSIDARDSRVITDVNYLKEDRNGNKESRSVSQQWETLSKSQSKNPKYLHNIISDFKKRIKNLSINETKTDSHSFYKNFITPDIHCGKLNHSLKNLEFVDNSNSHKLSAGTLISSSKPGHSQGKIPYHINSLNINLNPNPNPNPNPNSNSNPNQKKINMISATKNNNNIIILNAVPTEENSEIKTFRKKIPFSTKHNIEPKHSLINFKSEKKSDTSISSIASITTSVPKKSSELNQSSRVIDLTNISNMMTPTHSQINSSIRTTSPSSKSTYQQMFKTPGKILITPKYTPFTTTVTLKTQPTLNSNSNTNSNIKETKKKTFNININNFFNSSFKRKTPEKKVINNKESERLSTPGSIKYGKYVKSTSIKSISTTTNNNNNNNIKLKDYFKEKDLLPNIPKSKNQNTEFACCTLTGSDALNVNSKLKEYCKTNSLSIKEVNANKFECRKDNNVVLISLSKSGSNKVMKLQHASGTKVNTKEIIKNIIVNIGF